VDWSYWLDRANRPYRLDGPVCNRSYRSYRPYRLDRANRPYWLDRTVCNRPYRPYRMDRAYWSYRRSRIL